MADVILDRQKDYPANVSHFPVAFIYCKQLRRKKLFFLTVVFCFVKFSSPRTNICIENIFGTSVTCSLRNKRFRASSPRTLRREQLPPLFVFAPALTFAQSLDNDWKLL